MFWRQVIGHKFNDFRQKIGHANCLGEMLIFTHMAFKARIGFIFLLLGLGQALPARAAQAPSNTTTNDSAVTPKKMDGVILQAVETYLNPKFNEISFGIGVYPFDAYYYGLSINGGYTTHFSRNFAWEVLNAQYFFSFQKTLTTELADQYAVTPQSIPTLSYIISSDVQYTFAYGKFTMLEDYIRYFRASAIGGLGMVKTTPTSSVAAVFGTKFQVFTRESFSWNLEVRDNFAISTTSNYLTFVFGTGLSF
jgi:outer membrane beta-barrel protein